MKYIALTLMILISTTIMAQTGEKNFIDQNYIEVKGKAEMDIVPDQIYLKILLNEQEFKNKQPLTEVENQLFKTLKAIGIDIEKDLAIKDYASKFQFYWIGKSDIYITKEYQLMVKDAVVAGKVFVELEKIGISNVSIDRVDHTDIIDFRQEVKIEAIKAAKEKAAALAGAIGQEIGRALYIVELANNNPYVSNSLAGRSARANVTVYSDESPVNVVFEKIHIDYTILCRFELK